MTSGRCFCLLYLRMWVCACVCQPGLMCFPFSLWDACPEVRRRLQRRAAGLKGFYFSLSSVAPAKLHQRKMLHCRIYLHLHSRVWQQLKGALLCIFNALNQPVWRWQALVKLCSDLSRLANRPPAIPFVQESVVFGFANVPHFSTATEYWHNEMALMTAAHWDFVFIRFEKISTSFNRLTPLEILP